MDHCELIRSKILCAWSTENKTLQCLQHAFYITVWSVCVLARHHCAVFPLARTQENLGKHERTDNCSESLCLTLHIFFNVSENRWSHTEIDIMCHKLKSPSHYTMLSLIWKQLRLQTENLDLKQTGNRLKIATQHSITLCELITNMSLSLLRHQTEI